MESGQGEFTPADRIGQLTMRNLDIADSRDKLFVSTAGRATRPARNRLLCYSWPRARCSARKAAACARRSMPNLLRIVLT